MAVYPVFLANQSKILGMMSLIPKEALQFKGISSFDDMLSVLGFYSVNNIIYMMVLGSIIPLYLLQISCSKKNIIKQQNTC